MKHRSFLKWAGSKYSCIDTVLNALPPAKRLIEPFTGSGVILLNTDYSEYLLGENNHDLISLYRYLQRDGTDFIRYCQRWFTATSNESEYYYAIRNEFNHCEYTRKRAALFVYLNRHGYNGLCRYNQQGIYNVPFGRYNTPTLPEKQMLLFHEKSQNASFVLYDFRDAFKQAQAGDVMYCDPPYAPREQTSNFSAYTSHSFGEAEHIALATLAKESAARGITVVISNHDTPFVRKQYEGSKISSFLVKRVINRDGDKRQPVKELLAVFR